MNKIFISHSSLDIVFVQLFVEKILKLGLDISSDRIFCSSIEGQGIRSGKYIPDTLKDELKKSSLALLFISKNYKNSEVCLNEMGAAWVLLPKEKVIPILLPDADFNDLGFLDLGRIGLRGYRHEGVTKFVQDCKSDLNIDFNLERYSTKLIEYLDSINLLIESKVEFEDEGEDEEEDDNVSEWTRCFTNNLYALDEIIRSTIPTLSDGIHQITDKNSQIRLLTSLSKAKFLKRFWYKFSRGDYYVEKLEKLANGHWIISSLNWEIKVSEMWVSKESELQYEFILIKSEGLPPFEVQSDVGGESYRVGVLTDGMIVSENEQYNGYAVVNGETINLTQANSVSRYREKKSYWIFLVSDFHKAGYNYRQTFDFCKKIDSGEIELNEENMMEFLRNLPNHPTVIKYM
jgi:hypothetical protein